tara:strand:- start:1828 stop:2529 length:702 start_codon:yes stop_codon:yes gene_type:complete
MGLEKNIKTVTKEILSEEFLLKEIDDEIDSAEYYQFPTDSGVVSTDPTKGIVSPSKKVISNICKRTQICNEQGPITFGQLELLIKSAQKRKLGIDVGEGIYKSFIRLLPWFIPQIAIAAFLGSGMRASNKIVKPALETTKGYKRWWGKAVKNVMDLAEGELPTTDPLSKIFFISDGMLEMLNEKTKTKFTRYIAELASSKSKTEEVPEFFVENELRKWLNAKYLLNPPLKPVN